MARHAYLGEFELMVMLVLIRLGDDAYGVPISKELELHTGRDVAFGSVYAALDRLQGKGYISSVLGDPTPERGGRAKRFFSATPTGLRAVRETQRILVRLWQRLPQLTERNLA
jgi:PadR family transcriptional regulator, regulatory protein PadR